MTTIPQLPTDNLYKFMALAGVVLLVFGLSYPLRLATQLQLQLADQQVQVEISKLRTEQIEGRFDLIKRDKTATLSQSLELQSKLYDLREQTAVVSGAVEKARLLLYQFLFFAIIGLGCAVSGYLLARAGFKLWYVRVQKPADFEASRNGT